MKQKLYYHIRIWQANRRKRVLRASMSQRPTCSHSQESHKSPKLIAIIFRGTGADLSMLWDSCLVSGSAYVSCLMIQMTLFFVISSTPVPALTIFHPFLPWDSLSFEGRSMMETSNFRLSPRNIWLWISASLPFFCWRKPLWSWLDKSLIYEYSRISLGIILLIYFYIKSEEFM